MVTSANATTQAPTPAPTWRRRVFEVLEHGAAGGPASRWVSGGLIVLIVINLVAVVLGSVASIGEQHDMLLTIIELVSALIFTVEYLARLWVAVEHEPGASPHAAQARLAYATSLNGIIDLLAILPLLLGLFFPADLRAFLVFRIFRFFKLARYSVGVRSLLDALYEERKPLAGCVVIFAGAALVASSLMYLVEREVQPEKFGSIPQALWWAVSTLGTTGYGDTVPVTPVGKVIAGITIMFALVMVALPVGIVATAFSQNIHRRDFIVTWGMVARVPLFAGLRAGEIADICRLLRTETAEAGTTITRRGDPAHSMYFIATGAVEIELQSGTVVLGPDHFFGEIAVLRRARRSATVRAIQRTHLLVLDARDFRTLMSEQPDLAKRIGDVVEQRIGRELVTDEGDLVTEEVEDSEGASENDAGAPKA